MSPPSYRSTSQISPKLTAQHVDVLITGATVYYLLIKPRRIGASTGALVNSPLTRLLLVTARTNSLSLLVQTFTLVRAPDMAPGLLRR